MPMSEDFQNNGERLLKDARACLNQHAVLINGQRRLLLIAACLSLVSTLLLTAAFAVCWSRPSCGCRTHGDERRDS